MKVRVPGTRLYVLVSALILAVVMTGCSPGETPAHETPRQVPQEPAKVPTTTDQAEFKEIHSYEIDGQLWTLNPGQTISPDSRWVLATQTDADGTRVIALPLAENPAGAQVLHSADRNWTENRLFGYYPLGWTSPRRCLFLVQGWQNAGPHKGKSGIAIYESDLGDRGAITDEVAFIELRNGMVKSAFLVTGTKKVYLHVSKTIWECDLNSRKTRVVADGLPVYDGLFFVKPSPDGRYFAYDLYEDGAHGVYILDSETGVQRPLLPTSETMSFFPAWSPDGKYIAAYTVRKKSKPQEASGQGPLWQSYDVLEGEDGSQPVADAITVVDTTGRVVQTIRVEGQKVGYFRWGPRSNAIGFLSGSVQTVEGGIGQLQAEGVWLVPSGEGLSKEAHAEPLRLATIERSKPDENVYAMVWGVDPDGGGVLYNELRPDKALIKHARLESSKDGPDELEGDFADWGMEYQRGDIPIATVQTLDGSAVWAFRPTGRQEIVRFRPNRHTMVLGYNGNVLAVADCPLWSPEMAKPGAKVDKGVVKVFMR